MQDLSKRILLLRCEKGLTQKRLAENAGIAEITLRQYEAGKRTPRIEQINRLANALEVSVDYLLGYSVEQTEREVTRKAFTFQDYLSALGYEYEGEDENAFAWLRDIKTGAVYEMSIEEYEELSADVAKYAQFRINNFVQHARRLDKPPKG